MTKILNKTTLLHLLGTNTLFIIIFMTLNSQLCSDGYSGGQCVKDKDNFMFFILIGLNIAFSLFYLSKADTKKWPILLGNLLLTIVIYFVAAIIHSISTAGLF